MPMPIVLPAEHVAGEMTLRREENGEKRLLKNRAAKSGES